jgi:opine dehydrogenase
MKVTVVGSGHGGCAMAAVMAMRGHQVSLLKLGSSMHVENFRTMEAARRIRLTGIEGEGSFPLARVTTHAADAIPDAELILVYYVANYHAQVAEALAPYLHADQTVVLNPGYAGSLIFSQRMGQRNLPLFAEFETLPYSSRITEPGTVSIVSRNVRHPFATYPGGRAQELIDHFTPVLGECVPRKHILEVALHNPNVVIHTAGVLLNASLVENRDKPFAMYQDGFSPSVWNVVLRLDEEKMQVLEKLGAPRISYFDEFRLRTFEDTSIDALAGFNHYAGEAPNGPFTINHRYVTEDVPMGLGLLHSLGRHTSVPTPVCDSLIHLANAMLPQYDFWQETRTLEKIWSDSLESLLHVLTRDVHVDAVTNLNRV